VSRYRYDPWGNLEVHEEGPWVYNPLRFAARYWDWDTGLYYNRNRWYDAVTGRFLSEDPLGLAGGINLYAYAAKNPVDNTDPFGLFPCTHEQANRGECAKPLQGIVASVCRQTLCGWLRFGAVAAGSVIAMRLFEPPHAASLPSAQTVQCVGGLGLTTGGTASSLKEAEFIRGSGDNLEWRGKNGNWYRKGWGGNGATGGRNAIVATGQAARTAGRAFGAGSVGMGLLSAGAAVRSGNYWEAGRSAVDIGAAAAGTLGGPKLLAASVAWSGYRHFSGC
jgi:RHS repeat-associated protein